MTNFFWTDVPLDEAQLRQLVEVAARMWSIRSGGILTATPTPLAKDRAGLKVLHAEEPSGIEYPSLVDQRLVWLAIEHFTRGEELLVTWFSADHGATHALTRRRISRAVAHNLEITARAIAREASISLREGLEPAHDSVEVGRGAWEEASRLSLRSACASCPYRLGSNLDCSTCRAEVLGRKAPSAAWSRARVREGLLALDFDAEVADEAAAAAEDALAIVDAPMLTLEFFQRWSKYFAECTAGVFANEHDRSVASDLIEAQMLASWFAPPPGRSPPAQALDIPPALTEAEVKVEARGLLRQAIADGMPRADAEKHLRILSVTRKLFQAQAELYGEGARVVGGLGEVRLLIEHDGRPALLIGPTAYGQRAEAAPELPAADRERILQAVRIEHAALKIDDDGRSIDRAMINLRRSLDHYHDEAAPPPTPSSQVSRDGLRSGEAERRPVSPAEPGARRGEPSMSAQSRLWKPPAFALPRALPRGARAMAATGGLPPSTPVLEALREAGIDVRPGDLRQAGRLGEIRIRERAQLEVAKAALDRAGIRSLVRGGRLHYLPRSSEERNAP